ncbi:MAG TPA: S8 family serine peptidase [Thermoanaerobaculia bacterium]|nr:S8 family serine peptidase [Thermoanaerobaculia bacterium]
MISPAFSTKSLLSVLLLLFGFLAPSARLSSLGRANTVTKAKNYADGVESTQVELRGLDIDGDGRDDYVKFFKGRHALLAEWIAVSGNPKKRPVWAKADHVVISLDSKAKVEDVKSAIEALFDSFKLPAPIRTSLQWSPLNGRSYLYGLSVTKVEASADIAKILGSLPAIRKIQGVGQAGPDYIVAIDQQTTFPPLEFARETELKRIGAEKAWEKATGSNVRVAVLDSGIDSHHPDLPSANLLKLPGSNLVGGPSGPSDDPSDQLSHGTYCAAIVGAKSGNGKGMIGVAPDVTLMPIKFIDEEGSGTISQAAKAVELASTLPTEDQRAQIISASWGFEGSAPALCDAIAAAKDVLFVASAGDIERDLDVEEYFPASCKNLSNMIVVGANTQHDTRLPNSGFGKRVVDLSAPGDRIFSAIAVNQQNEASPYMAKSGASPAVAFVAGAAALIRSKNPDFGPRQIRCRLLQATDSQHALVNTSCSGGRLNLEKAVTGIGLRSNVCDCP